MLKQTHKLVTGLSDPESGKTYKLHMCGLCHALGDTYGLPYRLLTSHEMILLNMLITAQQNEEPVVAIRRCPLNPFKTVNANQDVASKFSSSVAVCLTKAIYEDKVQDSPRWNFIPRLMNLIFKRLYGSAIQNLEQMGFKTKSLSQLSVNQAKIEKGKIQNPAIPTAITSAELFEMAAHLAKNEDNKKILVQMGARYGEYVYLMDAFQDFPEDMQSGDYNPLRQFGRQTESTLELSPGGIEWLLRQLHNIQVDITSLFARLELKRYRQTLFELICVPVQATVDMLSKENIKDGLVFWQWRIQEILKAAAFVLPAIAIPIAPLVGSHNAKDAIDTLNVSNVIANCNDSIVHSQIGSSLAHINLSDIFSSSDWLSNLLAPIQQGDEPACPECARQMCDPELWKGCWFYMTDESRLNLW